MHRETKQPRSWEVIDSVLQRGDAIELARLFSCSPQLIRAYCRPPETEAEFATGKFNFLDRLRTVIAMVKEDDGSPERAYPFGDYVASLLGGVFVPVAAPAKSPESDLLSRLSIVLKETGEAIDAARQTGLEGRSTKKDKELCVKEIEEAIVALVQLKGWISPKTR